MKKKKKNVLTIDEYIDIGKSDIFVYIFIGIIFFFILLYISYKYNSYYFLLFDLYMVLRTLERIDTYNTLKNIKIYLVENNLLDKIGEIEYWNDKYYFLTENYMIIKQNKMINAFKYSEIERIFMEEYSKIGNPSYFKNTLHILTKKNEFKILTYSSNMVGEDYKDISKFLLEKNPKIVVSETFKDTYIDVFKIKY